MQSNAKARHLVGTRHTIAIAIAQPTYARAWRRDGLESLFDPQAGANVCGRPTSSDSRPASFL